MPTQEPAPVVDQMPPTAPLPVYNGAAQAWPPRIPLVPQQNGGPYQMSTTQNEEYAAQAQVPQYAAPNYAQLASSAMRYGGVQYDQSGAPKLPMWKSQAGFDILLDSFGLGTNGIKLYKSRSTAI